MAPMLSVSDVCRLFGWGRSKLYKLIRDGRFPRGRDIGGAQRWTQEDIDAYLLLAGRWYPGEGKEADEDD